MPTHLKARKPARFVSGFPDSLNLTEVMFSDPFFFHIIVGPHGVGNVRVAAAEASKSRAVKYLIEPPKDLEFFKLFYEPPQWLLYFAELLPCVIEISIANCSLRLLGKNCLLVSARPCGNIFSNFLSVLRMDVNMSFPKLLFAT